MIPHDHYRGQRLSLKNQLCTVRYIGPVAEKAGAWLGVEWDDPKRGKHNGTHEGVEYFQCRSNSSTAASFLRSSQLWDEPRTFLQALRQKYMPEFHENDVEIVYISGKRAEEVGFEKFHRRQAKLQGINVLVLDHMLIQHRRSDPTEDFSIAQLCADITELDLSGNLFETFDEILDLCNQFPKLKVLTLDGNCFAVDMQANYSSLPMVQTLSLSRTLLTQEETNKVLTDNITPIFPALKTLNLASNEITGSVMLLLPPSLFLVDLSDNDFHALSDLKGLEVNCPTLHTLVLKRNQISRIYSDESNTAHFSLRIVELDLSYNAIDSFSFFNTVNIATFPCLKHLRVAGNPLYKSLVSAEGKPLTKEDGYMLTIARLPQLEYLNYAKITEKERLNAETYYLNQVGLEISNISENKEKEVIARHPRWRELCEDYGEPTIERKTKKNEVDPNSLAARLVSVTFTLAPNILSSLTQRSWTEEVPKSFNIYSLLGMVGKKLNHMPLNLRLILETNERDPVGRDSAYAGPEWWDSSDDDAETNPEGAWVTREVEMMAGTRAVGTYVEAAEASVRIEKMSDND